MELMASSTSSAMQSIGYSVMGAQAVGRYRQQILRRRSRLIASTVQASLQRESVSRLMASFRNGDHEAAGRLVELFYPELRRIAAARMRAERADHTLQPTAVVHQLYLELVKVKALRPAGSDGADEKAAFLGLAAYLMK